jgi:hypothetical protein
MSVDGRAFIFADVIKDEGTDTPEQEITSIGWKGLNRESE